jgi:uncharacterized membrane protein
MTKASPAFEAKLRTRERTTSFTTATVVSFSLTLFVAGLAVLFELVPLAALTFVERIDVGTMLFVAPIVALILAVLVETTRIALSREPLPEPRRQQVVRHWTPGRREG